MCGTRMANYDPKAENTKSRGVECKGTNREIVKWLDLILDK